jgi:hypothetical protein
MYREAPPQARAVSNSIGLLFFSYQPILVLRDYLPGFNKHRISNISICRIIQHRV